MIVTEIRQLHWVAKAAIGLMLLFLALFVWRMLEVGIVALFTPLIVIIIAGALFLAYVIYYMGRWVKIQETKATGDSPELENIQREILLLRQSIDTMQKKLDKIEHILEKVSD